MDPTKKTLTKRYGSSIMNQIPSIMIQTNDSTTKSHAHRFVVWLGPRSQSNEDQTLLGNIPASADEWLVWPPRNSTMEHVLQDSSSLRKRKRKPSNGHSASRLDAEEIQSQLRHPYEKDVHHIWAALPDLIGHVDFLSESLLAAHASIVEGVVTIPDWRVAPLILQWQERHAIPHSQHPRQKNDKQSGYSFRDWMCHHERARTTSLNKLAHPLRMVHHLTTTSSHSHGNWTTMHIVDSQSTMCSVIHSKEQCREAPKRTKMNLLQDLLNGDSSNADVTMAQWRQLEQVLIQRDCLWKEYLVDELAGTASVVWHADHDWSECKGLEWKRVQEYVLTPRISLKDYLRDNEGDDTMTMFRDILQCDTDGQSSSWWKWTFPTRNVHPNAHTDLDPDGPGLPKGHWQWTSLTQAMALLWVCRRVRRWH